MLDLDHFYLGERAVTEPSIWFTREICKQTTGHLRVFFTSAWNNTMVHHVLGCNPCVLGWELVWGPLPCGQVCCCHLRRLLIWRGEVLALRCHRKWKGSFTVCTTTLAYNPGMRCTSPTPRKVRIGEEAAVQTTLVLSQQPGLTGWEQAPAKIKCPPWDSQASISVFSFLNVPHTARFLKICSLVFYTLAVVTHQTSWTLHLQQHLEKHLWLLATPISKCHLIV